MNEPSSYALLQEVYQELIMDHYRHPRHFGTLSHPTHQGEGINPLCGDDIKLYLEINKTNKIQHIQFTSEGCALSRASASMMTEALKGKTVEDALSLFEQFHQSMLSDTPSTRVELDKIRILAQVKAFPMRVKCVTLPWHTLKAALTQHPTPITTE